MNLLLEMFFLKIDGDYVHYFKTDEDITSSVKDPDKTVQGLIQNKFYETPRMIQEDYIIHSTSWRYEDGGEIVLTYIIYSDHLNFDTLECKTLKISDLRISSNPDIKRPRPDVITEANVVAHAIRHICYLVNKEPVKYARVIKPVTLQACKLIENTLAGRIGNGE